MGLRGRGFLGGVSLCCRVTPGDLLGGPAGGLLPGKGGRSGVALRRCGDGFTYLSSLERRLVAEVASQVV